MASSSSSSISHKYDVFLNFRGEDTRENFISHLFAALRRKKINTFIDEDINKGERISTDLLNVIIERSKISITIFSKNYADSKWCLNELVKILDCKKMHGQIVIPVFYHVHPSDVRKQTASFGDAFVQHEKKFKEMPERIQKWRSVLTEASYLSGHESMKIRPEVKLVDVIIEDVLNKLQDITVSNDSNDLVGINRHIEEVKSLLCIGLSDFRIVGIWGMGGIGKTTIAEALFKQISKEFEGTCFMANVREESEKGVGLLNLHKQVLSQLLQEKIEIGGPNIPQHTKDRLRHMKIFVVLDDVNKFRQLEHLVGGIDRFGPGSRIIVTTRDRQVLDKYGVDHIYKVMGMKDHEALEYFSNFAFRQNHCPQAFTMLSQRVLDYAKGNPLALKVLGSFLRPKSKLGWENALHNLGRISNPDIFEVLKISYDELEWELKNIFLDIACFFNGDDEDQMASIFDNYYLMHYGLDVLVEKSLITISNKKLGMHDLLQEMGRKIVCDESPEEPGRRSRLWDYKDVCYVLQKNKGTNSIKGIFLNLSKISHIYLDSKVFANMYNLRYLKFYMPFKFDGSSMSSKVRLPQGLELLHDELRYLHWDGYPLRTLPKNFNPENLIELNLSYSKIEQVWEGKKEAAKLKSMHLSHCDYLSSIPDPFEIPNVERIILSYCKMLSHIPSSAQNFNNLGLLCLSGCTSLRNFPPNIHFRSPINIEISQCINLTEFPSISGNVIHLKLSSTAIEEVPSSISRLTSLKSLNMWDCHKLKCISTNICKLKSLSSLNLLSCPNLESLPTSIKQLSHLKEFYLSDCNMLESLPELPPSLSRLGATNCNRLESLPKLTECLESLDALLLETLSQSSDAFSRQRKNYAFHGCPKLKEKANILADSQLRIQHMAIAVLYEKIPAGFVISLSGSAVDIPEWFSNRCFGSSITIQLPLHYCNTHFIGFALCAVIGFEEDYKLSGRSNPFVCSCRVAIRADISKSLVYNILVDSASDQVILGFEPCRNIVRLHDGDHHTAVSFDFSASYMQLDEKTPKLRVKCCGVCPVYAHPNESPPNTFTVNMVPPTEGQFTQFHDKARMSTGTFGSIFSRYDDEEVQPSPKRICREHINSP